MRVPVFLLLLGKAAIDFTGYDVFDAQEARLGFVVFNDDALKEARAHFHAIVVGFHL